MSREPYKPREIKEGDEVFDNHHPSYHYKVITIEDDHVLIQQLFLPDYLKIHEFPIRYFKRSYTLIE